MASSLSRLGWWWIGGASSGTTLASPVHFSVDCKKTASTSPPGPVIANHSMPNLFRSSAKCLAVTFIRQSSTPAGALGIFDLFMAFKCANIANYCKHHPWLAQAIQHCHLLGHLEPYVLLVGGSDQHLKVIRQCWMRNQLRSPFGFRIKTISDAGGLLMQRVPQYMSMRLDEVICQLIRQNNQLEISCSFDQLLFCLHYVCVDLQTPEPSSQSVLAALNSLMASGVVYFNGQGYSLLTQEKLAVVKWLANIPESLPPPDPIVDVSRLDDDGAVDVTSGSPPCFSSPMPIDHRVHFNETVFEPPPAGKPEPRAPLAEHEALASSTPSQRRSTTMWWPGGLALPHSSDVKVTLPSCRTVAQEEEEVRYHSATGPQTLPGSTTVNRPRPARVVRASQNRDPSAELPGVRPCPRMMSASLYSSPLAQPPGHGDKNGETPQSTAPMRWLLNRIRKLSMRLHQKHVSDKSASAVASQERLAAELVPVSPTQQGGRDNNGQAKLKAFLPLGSSSLLRCFAPHSRSRAAEHPVEVVQSRNRGLGQPSAGTNTKTGRQVSMTASLQTLPAAAVESAHRWRSQEHCQPLVFHQPAASVSRSAAWQQPADNTTGASVPGLLPWSCRSLHPSATHSSGSPLHEPLPFLSEDLQRMTEDSTVYNCSHLQQCTGSSTRPATHDSGFVDSTTSGTLPAGPAKPVAMQKGPPTHCSSSSPSSPHLFMPEGLRVIAHLS